MLGIRAYLAGALAVSTAIAITCAGIVARAQSGASGGTKEAAPGVRHITQGRARMVAENLYQCPVELANLRKTGVGTITATDGTVLTVPAETLFQKGVRADSGDLHNLCAKVDPKTEAEVKALTEKTPIVEIDADGEVITGYLMVDNYFELFVNGKLVAVDAVPFTPMNANIVRFKAKRPYTLVFKMVDWEENLGLASELNRANQWHPGDGGLIARFSDGTVTDSTWRAQTFYVGPLAAPEDVIEKRGGVRDTTKLGRTHPLAKNPECQDKCYGVHYPIPAGWDTAAFNDRIWPRAYEYTDEEIGVNAMTGYTRFPQLFDDARWIWSSNLVFDNVVIARKTVR